MLTYETLDTADGPFTVVEQPDGAVVAAGWTADANALIARTGLGAVEAVQGVCASVDAVRAYHSGDPIPVTRVRLATLGTEFQRAVWEQLRRFPQVRCARTERSPRASAIPQRAGRWAPRVEPTWPHSLYLAIASPVRREL